MSTIFLDPVQMDATAGHIGEHVNELTTLTADLETACSAAVPASIAGWLAEELRDITVTARMIALLYSVAALDTAQRAQQIQADQSLATAAPSLASASPTFTGAPLVGGFGAYGSPVPSISDLTGGSPLVGGFGAYGSSTIGSVFDSGQPMAGGLFLGATSTSGHVFSAGLSTEAFAFHNRPWGSSTLSGTFGGGSTWPWNSNLANILAPDGLSAVSPGVYEDQYGQQGTLNQTVRDPRTGDAEF